MIHFKSLSTTTKGFTLTEVLLALAILGIVVTPLFVLQTSIMRSVTQISRQVDRIFPMTQFLFEARFKALTSEKAETQTMTTPDGTTISYDQQKLTEETPKMRFILKETVRAQWLEAGRQRIELLGALIFKPGKTT